MTRHSAVRRAAVMLAAALVACAPLRSRPTAWSFDFAVDTMRTIDVADGATRTFVYAPRGPWAINVLDVRLDRCFSAVAAKGAPGAAGRIKTSDILRDLDKSRDVVGGVNADFFSLQTGVPTNALVMRGRVVTPPSRQPVFAVDSAGMPRIAVLQVPGVRTFTVDDTALARVSLTPFHPMEAVGGRPRLVGDSAIVPDVDSVGGAGFATTRHPRTAVGIAAGGKRLILVVVDGRQVGYSAGMTLRELASLMLSLGAPEAINLDGGGSTTMVVATGRGGALRVVNSPSDPSGERAVGDALSVVRGCRGR